MFTFIRIMLISVLTVHLSSCSTIMKGSRQSINVESTPAGANCIMRREGTVLARRKTPFITNIEKDSDEIITECKKRGYHRGTKSTDSDVSGWVWGNILLGGIIGLAVDAGTGAMYEYPSNIYLNLDKKSNNNDNKMNEIPRDWDWHEDSKSSSREPASVKRREIKNKKSHKRYRPSNNW